MYMKKIKLHIGSPEVSQLSRFEFADVIHQINAALKPHGLEIEPELEVESNPFIEASRKIMERDSQIANEIANRYLQEFPRELSYGVTLASTEDDSVLTSYHVLPKEELEILKKCSAIAIEERCDLSEILSEEGHDDLVEKLLEHDTPMPFNLIKSIDLDNPLQFTIFSFQSIDEDGTLQGKRYIGTPLTDDEFKEILIELLLNSNRYSMNMLMYHKPELCQEIMKHLSYASLDYQFENHSSFIADMCELKDVCDRILNPFIDILNIFNSEDESIAKFAVRHQIVPQGDNEIYVRQDDKDWFHCIMTFHGTRLDFLQEGISIDGKEHDCESFSIDSKKLMEKFSIETPEQILPYLKEHYNAPDSIHRIKKDLEG